MMKNKLYMFNISHHKCFQIISPINPFCSKFYSLSSSFLVEGSAAIPYCCIDISLALG